MSNTFTLKTAQIIDTCLRIHSEMWSVIFPFPCHCHLHIYKKRALFILHSPATSILLIVFPLQKKIKLWNPFKNKIHQEYRYIEQIKAQLIWLKRWGDHEGSRGLFLFPTHIPPSHRFSLLLHQSHPTKSSLSSGKILTALMVLGNKCENDYRGIFWIMMLMWRWWWWRWGW